MWARRTRSVASIALQGGPPGERPQVLLQGGQRPEQARGGLGAGEHADDLGAGRVEIGAVAQADHGAEDDLQRHLLEERVQAQALAHAARLDRPARGVAHDGGVLEHALAVEGGQHQPADVEVGRVVEQEH